MTHLVCVFGKCLDFELGQGGARGERCDQVRQALSEDARGRGWRELSRQGFQCTRREQLLRWAADPFGIGTGQRGDARAIQGCVGL
jgi:hypothetical protein